MSTLSHKRRHNHVVRATLRRKYIYMKTGSMSGDVRECVRRRLLHYWSDNKMVRSERILYYQASGSFRSAILVMDRLTRFRVKAIGSPVVDLQTASRAPRKAGDRTLKTSWWWNALKHSMWNSHLAHPYFDFLLIPRILQR
ncbi:hypothetical protein JG688_00007718 [Phytophthora aleatoria]|uniref:Uncharacterized protein n=1 Tax=Phytophthora aleatoria TaxID=2496075 RepID=A0A8J5MGD1_9STRA|nr:hypothetical protein JG688_00007718 [Phytophthora aleatoria]